MAKQNVNQVKISDEDLEKIRLAVEQSRPKGYFENLKEQQISPKEAMEFVKENPEVLKLLVLKKGGKVTDENYDMLRGKIKEVKHHASELQSITNRKKQVPAWVLAKSTRASTDLSDITHYMDSQKFSGGGGVDNKGGAFALSEKQKDTLYNSWVNAKNKLLDLSEDLKKAKRRKDEDSIIEINKAIKITKLYVSSFQKMMKENDIKFSKGGGVESTSHIQGEIDDIRNWDNDEIANYIGVPISYVARDRNRYVREAQNYMMLNTFETGGNIGFKELSSRVAKRYQGKAVQPKYQSQYGKRYSKSEAREVGDKVAGKVYWQQQGRKFTEGGGVGNSEPIDYRRIVELIKGANNPDNDLLFYSSYSDSIQKSRYKNSAQARLTGSNLVEFFNQPQGTSRDIIALFKSATKNPQKTKTEIERLSEGKIGVSFEDGYDKEIIVKYRPRYTEEDRNTLNDGTYKYNIYNLLDKNGSYSVLYNKITSHPDVYDFSIDMWSSGTFELPLETRWGIINVYATPYWDDKLSISIEVIEEGDSSSYGSDVIYIGEIPAPNKEWIRADDFANWYYSQIDTIFNKVEEYLDKGKKFNGGGGVGEYEITRTDRVYPYSSYKLDTTIESLKKSGWEISDSDIEKLNEDGEITIYGGRRGDKITIKKTSYSQGGGVSDEPSKYEVILKGDRNYGKIGVSLNGWETDNRGRLYTTLSFDTGVSTYGEGEVEPINYSSRYTKDTYKNGGSVDGISDLMYG